ncbi:MAG: PD-(D/E)XK nuclease family protein [Candidatus Methanofastidiosia archaeon]
MTLSSRDQPYRIPEYSLTGDLLAYLNCGLQYRYHNRGCLPPSKPIQLWFGEFIHSVMEEAFIEWKQNTQRKRFPWKWNPEIRNIELQISKRLRARGLSPPANIFCPYESSFQRQGWCPDGNHPHKLIASRRAEEAINTWGEHLFPLIDSAEVHLKGIRDMPGYKERESRCDYYEITGIIDVISSVNLHNLPSGNLILHYIQKNPAVKKYIDSLTVSEYEIIVDYKGMGRPSLVDPRRNWTYHEWQILTYAWLRSQQPEARTIAAGIIFYLNELTPLRRDIKELRENIEKGSTDIMPQGRDLQVIQNLGKNVPFPFLSKQLREERSIRVIPISEERVQASLHEFDDVVGDIESCVKLEISGNGIKSSWPTRPLGRMCTICDFKTFCPSPRVSKY